MVEGRIKTIKGGVKNNTQDILKGSVIITMMDDKRFTKINITF